MSWFRRSKTEQGDTDATDLSAVRTTPEYVNWIITLIGVVLTIGLTAVAFWLSYEHLHDVAAAHGLSGVRAWAWPATLDTFIVIGEVLILRASIMRTVDKWAIFLTVVGSVGSIVLNVTGVGTDGGRLDYTVAAVPPVAALMAFGILMRQLHRALSQRIYGAPVTAPAVSRDMTEPLSASDTELADGIMVRLADGEPDDPLEYSPDAYRYEAGDQDGPDTTMDADLAALRRRTRDTVMDAFDVPASMVVSPWDIPRWDIPRPRPEEWRSRLSVVPQMPDVPPVIHTEGQDMSGGVPADVSVSRGHVHAVPDVLSRGDSAGDRTWDTGQDTDQGQTAVSRPAGVPRDTDTGDTGTGRDNPRTVPSRTSSVPVPRDTGTRGHRRTSVTGRVRDIVRDNPNATDDQIRDKFAGEGIRPNTLNKSIKRVRDEQ